MSAPCSFMTTPTSRGIDPETRTGWGMVESAWGAVPVLPSVRFPRPLSEPAVRVSTLCRIRHSVEYAEPRIMPSRWSLRLVRRLAVVWIFGIIWAAVRIDAVFRRGRVLRWRRRDHEQAVTIAGVGVGAAAGLCGGFPRGVVNAGVFGAFGRRASAADGAFKSVAGRNRFGPRRIDPVAG